MRGDLARTLARHRLEVDIPKDLPLLNVDPVLIGQALANVIENAAKYAPAGTVITLAARIDGDTAEIAVSDEGPGIPVMDKTRVFDLFHRAAKGDGAPAGTGMGLAIVRVWWRPMAVPSAQAMVQKERARRSRCACRWRATPSTGRMRHDHAAQHSAARAPHPHRR